MRRCFSYLLPILVVVAACFSYAFRLKVLNGIYPELPATVRSLDTFNDVGGFVQDASSPRVFRYIGNQTANETYLRFAIPDFNPVGYMLVIRIRARPALLESSYQRFAKGRAEGHTIQGDIATYVIKMKDTDPFVWTNGKIYVGIGFPASSLRENDVVELVDFNFACGTE